MPAQAASRSPNVTSTVNTSRGSRDMLPSLSYLPRSIRFQDEEMAQAGSSSRHSQKDSLELGPVESGVHSEDRPVTSRQLFQNDDASEGGDPVSRSQSEDRESDKMAPQGNSIYQHRRPRNRCPSQSRNTSQRTASQESNSRRVSFAASTSNLPRFLLGTSSSSIDIHPDTGGPQEIEPTIGHKTAILLLILSSLLVAVCAEFLVNTLDDIVSSGPFSQAFIGLIILPIAGNCAELFTATIVAARGNFDLAIGVSVGSSVQISLLVTPLVVLAGWAMKREMTMYFGLFEIVALFATTFLVNSLILSSRTNALEGSILCACYFIMGVGAYLFPT